MIGISSDVNSRRELAAKHIPDISFKNCDLYLADSVRDWYVLKTNRYNRNTKVEGGNRIEINNLTVHGGENATCHLQTDKIELKHPFDVQIKKVNNKGGKIEVKQDWFWPLSRRETVCVSAVLTACLIVAGVVYKNKPNGFKTT